MPSNQYSSVMFMVRDESPERGLAVIKAIEDLHNIWIVGSDAEYDIQYTMGSIGNYIRPHLNWRSDLQEPLLEDENGTLVNADSVDHSYVYSYAAPVNYSEWLGNCDPMSHGYHTPKSSEFKSFYIGCGTGARWLAHIPEAMQHVSLQNVPPGSHIEYGKILKIYEHLTKTAEHACQELVRKVAIFTGAYAKEKSFAAEHFLINYYGIYQLKNLTSGNMSCEGMQFIARPKHCMGGLQWLEVVTEFAEDGLNAWTQTRANHLSAFALNQEFPSFLTDDDEIHPSLSVYRVNTTAAFTTDGTDVFSQMQIRDEYGALLVMLDLKVSDVSPSCVINLRPAPNRKAEFVKLIADTFFEGDIAEASSRVKNQSHDPFFKPCAANSDGRRDVWFDFTDVDQAIYQIVDCPWLGHGPLWGNASLRDVLHAIVNKFL
ncbi:hypothetical protein [Polynucleobacter sp. MWH-UH2A]|uniref:hypothetical protein n=1 Tax=Polynucleobacter sp. MWH-UH2A TaxID=1855617 RepID=UPI001BFE7896|nr:hypothetical protein [Polynucleobacter sp. MWH-UH2A]